MILTIYIRLLFLAALVAVVGAFQLEERQEEATPASPTESVGCTLHEDHWHCEGPATGTVDEDIPPSPTNSGECTLHIDHWHCEGGESESESEASTSNGGECVIHGGHTHGDCSNACEGLDIGEYDEGLHIASIFVLLVASIVGVFVPIYAGKASGSVIFSSFLFVARHFGTGIIISTAFVHLLYHAFVMFSNDCLGHLAYEPASAAIAMAGTLIVFLIDVFIMRFMKARLCHHDPSTPPASAPIPENEAAKGSIANEENGHPEEFTSMQERADVSVLEAGIIFHSIMIGVALGATGGSEWIPLFVAIVFHQFFEGLALGSRIAPLKFVRGGGLRKFIMGAAFSITTPIGIAIGVGVHHSYNVNSREALLAIGILDAISAGILLYAALVEMLSKDYLSKGLANESAGRLATALISMTAGLALMSLLGKWA